MRRIVLVLSLAAALAACAPVVAAEAVPAPGPSVPAPSQAELLKTYVWQPLRASDAQGRAVRALRGARKRGLWVRFDDRGNLHYQGACNTSGGSYRIEGDRILRGPVDGIQTVAGCGRRQAMEEAFFAQPLLDTRFVIDTQGRAPLLHLIADDGARMELIGVTAAPAR